MLKNVLVIYKRSAYRIYFQDKNSSLKKFNNQILKREVREFEKAHHKHYGTLKEVARVLYTHGVRFTENYRGRKVNYSKYDVVITVGGDGTFLEASRHITNQIIIGVNSAPDHSVGRFCTATAENFEKILLKLLRKRHQLSYFQRLKVSIEGIKKSVNALNDILICHKNPAMLCRYYITLNKCKEEQRSSGIWISTAAGSSGAVLSAGGRILSPYNKMIQYMPRELYSGKGKKYRLNGGVLKKNPKLTVVSLMRQGRVYLDGAHHYHDLSYGKKVTVELSSHPVKTVKG